jgi:DNA-binding transcriptional ArsR family regulator
MSGRDRLKATQRRLAKGGRWNATEVFASIPSDWMLAAATNVPAVAFRCWWLANANWRPAVREGERGRAVLAYAAIQHPLGPDSSRGARPQPGRTTIARQLRAALEARFIELAVPGARPRQPGGARGKATEYFLPCRDGNVRPPGELRTGGKVRLHCARMRALAASLSPDALRLLGSVIAQRPRDRYGALLDRDPLELPVAELSLRLELPRSTVAELLAELREAGHLRLAEASSGRRAARYNLAPVFTAFVASATLPAAVQKNTQ